MEIDEVESFPKTTITGSRIIEAFWITYREKILKYIDLGMEYCCQHSYYINNRTHKILLKAILKLALWKTTFSFTAEELDLTETIEQDLPGPKFDSDN